MNVGPSMLLRRGLACSLLAMALAGSAASAQSGALLPSFRLEQLQLNPSNADAVATSRGKLLPEGAWHLGLVFHYESRPLVLTQDGATLGAVVSDRATAHLLAAWALHRRFELGLSIPVVQLQRGQDFSNLGVTPPESAGFGMPVVDARLGLLQQSFGDPIDVAAELGVGLPLGTLQALSREQNLTFLPKLMFGHDFDPVAFGVEVGALFRNKVSFGPDQLGNQLSIGAVLSTQASEKLRLELEGRSYVSLTGLPTNYEILGGGFFAFTPAFQMFALGGPGLGTAPGTPAWRVLLGFGFTHLPEQIVPARVEPVAALVEVVPADPCAPGISHTAAQCPKLDDDNDGIANAVDACPLEAGSASLQGCPVRDRDNDGVADDDDKCPDQAGPKENGGCPIKDSDNDGVRDEFDNCPNEAGPPTNQGCPDKVKQLVQITSEKLVIKDKTFFATNRSRILPRSFALLDQVALVLNAHPDLTLVEVQGHTDNRGGAEHNRKLSQERADAVRTYLVDKGVAPRRLDAKGFGSDQPAAPNVTSQGRELNRRVEFKLPERNPAPKP